MKPQEYSSGLICSAGNGSRNTGFEELSVTHPYSASGQTALNSSRFEANPYPRAIIERSIQYNADFCASVSGAALQPMNEYFAP